MNLFILQESGDVIIIPNFDEAKYRVLTETCTTLSKYNVIQEAVVTDFFKPISLYMFNPLKNSEEVNKEQDKYIAKLDSLAKGRKAFLLDGNETYEIVEEEENKKESRKYLKHNGTMKIFNYGSVRLVFNNRVNIEFDELQALLRL